MVTTDPDEAMDLVARGDRAVLVVAPAHLPSVSPVPGRLAVLVADPGDPAAQQAALEMDAELYRAAPRQTAG